ncbi:MAG TPA: ankyrin repeat domain-containing protein [Vicinamibacterales bacterium]|nr:ankyrin repeat domain-containing protein [Vicinamibacterales bacterium]
MMGAWLSPPVLERLAGSLLHFVWQGAAIAILAALTLGALRRRSAESRYAVASAGLLAMVLAPVATFVFYEEAGALAQRLLRSLDDAAAIAAAQAPASGVNLWTRRIVALWAAGVVVCMARLAGGWLLSRGLVRSASAVATPVVQEAMRLARAGLGFDRAVRVLAGTNIGTPVVVGWLRPAILLPASAVTGLDADQLLAILAHELAHIRRQDFLVNALQRAVECVLFYHPAVWWISRRVRVERERCCDDLAVRVCGDRLVYARSLIALEKARSVGPALAVPAAGDSLTDRVRRILGAGGTSLDWPSAMAALVCVAILVGAGLSRPIFAEPAVLPAPRTSTAPPRTPEPPAETPGPIASPLSAIAAIATAQNARPAAPISSAEPRSPGPQVTQPTISAARQAAREKLGQLRVEYSADSFARQAAEGDTIAVKLFLAAGMDIDARDQEGFTALARAARKRQTETAQSLVAAGADPNLAVSKDPAWGSPLAFAAENGDVATMKVLLLGGAKVDLKVGRIGETPLLFAAYAGHRDAAALLLDNKADIEARTTDQSTAILAAVCSRNSDVMRVLGDRGADVNAASFQQRTALHCAAQQHDLEAMEYLVGKGADVNAAAKSRSPLLSALSAPNTDATRASAAAVFLIDRGADVNVTADDSAGSTPLILAVRRQLPDVVGALLARGADPNAKAKNGETALMRALGQALGGTEANASLAMVLIARGADVNLPGRSIVGPAPTPLLLAVQAKNIGLVRALLARGADPNAPTAPSPLSAAAGNEEIVKLLTDAGAKP